ncbi:UDP-galactopyranose mutase [Klebsiella pneumoniae]|uniref:UDP-galactopyranose mutase n=2 Tax=Klebsiella pneumoniae TaxID=573 RepID=UPI00355751DB
MKYDFLIVGSGLFGATFAYEASKKGKKCLVIDKRPHLGGNIYTENVEGINVHKYGAHIFHTNDKSIWEYIQQFAEFNRFTNSPLAIFKDEQYNLPFNMNTFHQLWGVKTPNDAKKIIEEQIARENIKDPQNLEEQAISLVGRDIYEKLIKGYTEKQWGRDAKTIPAFIIKRLPVRYTYDNNYFNDKYQGIPIGGYTQIIEKMLHGIETSLNTDFFKDRHYYESIADKILFTGMIDEYFNYKFGELEYRSLRFENNLLNVSNFLGNAVVNYTEKNIEYTRIIEHKHFEFGEQDKTVITKEYPADWKRGDEPYYPINDSKNTELYIKYMKLAEGEKNVIFGGRLGMYKYFDMHHILAEALKCVSHHVE